MLQLTSILEEETASEPDPSEQYSSNVGPTRLAEDVLQSNGHQLPIQL